MAAVPYSSAQGRRDLLDAVGDAVDDLGRALAALGDAYERLDEHAGDALERTLFAPVQGALGRLRRAHSDFAARHGLPARAFAATAAGAPSTGVKGFLDGAVAAVTSADATLATLQDSMLPVEVGDPELRAALASARAQLAGFAGHARELRARYGR